jgi:hypothetical protein
VRELLKELETKESANKETVQILKQEFVEHKTTYEKVDGYIPVNVYYKQLFNLGTTSLFSKS